MDFLHLSVDKRLILVCAAAGYGKTTLLVDFAHDADIPVCWYSLDASDSDPRAFFEYLILSMRQRFPSFGRQTEDLLASLSDVTRDLNSVVASIVNEIQSDIPEYFLLVLDDFHWVDDAESINTAIDQLIFYLPDNCHLVLSTRTLPHLTYSRLAALRQVSGLGTTDLRFTVEELTALLRDNYRLVVPASQAEELAAASEGWIAGILLSTHSLWMGLVESLVKARGTGSPLFDYLANEAYLQQPEEVQRFLLCSSVLDQINPQLCDRLFANGSASSMLEYLARSNLFIEQIDGPGDWYRYHNLFQSFLRTKLKAENPALHVQIHRAAAAIAEGDGDWDRALRHYEEANALGEAATLVERVGEEMMRTGRWQTLYRWIDSLPPAAVESRPKLGQLRGRTHIWAGEHEKAIPHLTRSVRLYLDAHDTEGAGASLTLKGVALRVKGRFEEAIGSCQEALALQGGAWNRVAAEACQDIGICLASQGQLAEANAQLEEALRICENLSDNEGVATISEAMGIIAVRLGDLARGMAYYERALAVWRSVGSASSTAGVLNSIGMVHCYLGEYDEAQELLQEALRLAKEGGYLRMEAGILGSIAQVHRDSGNLREAQETYEAALDLANRVDDIQQICSITDGLANTHRLLGDYATAERLLRRAIQLANEAQITYNIASLAISQGVLAEELGDSARAEKLLKDATRRLAASGARRDLARARFHLARSLFARGQRGAARRELNASLELCRQLGYDQFMVSEGTRAGEFIRWAVGQGIGGRRLALVEERLAKLTERGVVIQEPRIRLEQPKTREIKIYAFGAARVEIDSRTVSSSEWAVEKTKELFFYLLQHPAGLRKEQIIDTLWPEMDLGKGNSQFHSTMYRLRQATFPQSVVYRDGRYTLTLGNSYWYDVSEFLALLEKADDAATPSSEQAAALDTAISLHGGPFLEEFYCDWAGPIRDTLEEKYVGALNSLARLKAKQGHYDHALELLRSAVATDPFQEAAHYAFVHYSALLGDRASALRHYREYVELLQDELGAKPSAKLTTLASIIASGKSAPPLDVPAS